MPPSQYYFCAVKLTIVYSAILGSVLLVLSMTFDRFYSIIKPHKAASVNTVTRAKITTTCNLKYFIQYSSLPPAYVV